MISLNFRKQHFSKENTKSARSCAIDIQVPREITVDSVQTQFRNFPLKCNDIVQIPHCRISEYMKVRSIQSKSTARILHLLHSRS